MYNMLKPSHSLKVCVSQKKASAHLCLFRVQSYFFFFEREQKYRLFLFFNNI